MLGSQMATASRPPSSPSPCACCILAEHTGLVLPGDLQFPYHRMLDPRSCRLQRWTATSWAYTHHHCAATVAGSAALEPS